MITIVVTEYLDQPRTAGKRPRCRWSARFIESDRNWEVRDCLSIDEAIGRLVLDDLKTGLSDSERMSRLIDDTFDGIAALFGDVTERSAEEVLGKAIRLAARNPRRLHPGCAVRIEPIAAGSVATARRTIAPDRPVFVPEEKGGAA